MKIKDLQSTSKYYRKDFEQSGLSTLDEIIKKCNENKGFVNTALLYIPFLDFSNTSNLDMELEKLRLFLYENKSPYLKRIETSSSITAFKKVIVLYDKLKFGW